MLTALQRRHIVLYFTDRLYLIISSILATSQVAIMSHHMQMYA